MPNQTIQMPWTEQGWLEQVSDWIHAELTRHGIEVTGSIDQPPVGFGSAVLRVASTAGDIYFKAAGPANAHEPALSDLLWRWRPDCMPEVLAVDTQRGWMLTPDLGATLRSLILSTRDLKHWQRVLVLLAEVQIDLSSRALELLKLGALDRRLAELPNQYEQLLTDTDALRLGRPDGLSNEAHRRLLQLSPGFRVMCEQLAAYQIPETLFHEDFHGANIFVRKNVYTFADWGESGVGHLFCTLLVTSRVIAWRLELADDAPELMHLRDIYLEAWSSFEPRENLIAAFKLAYRVGMVCRALTWRRVLAGVPEPIQADDAEAVPGWLQEFLGSEEKHAG